MNEWEPEPIEQPINGVIDLHTFHPRETAALLDAYFDECLAEGILEVRVIHGKGIGVVKRTVESFLQKDPRVRSFAPGGQSGGGWGATVVSLKAPD